VQEIRDDRVGKAVKAGEWPDVVRRAEELLERLPRDRRRLDAVLDLVAEDPVLYDAAASLLTSRLIVEQRLDLHEARWVVLRFAEYEEAHRRGGIRDGNIADALRRHLERRAIAPLGERPGQPPR
jgi:hypothetical protein